MIGALVSFLTWLLGLIFKRPAAPIEVVEAAKAATAEASATVTQAAAASQERMAAAVVDAPTTQAALVDQLNKGEF